MLTHTAITRAAVLTAGTAAVLLASPGESAAQAAAASGRRLELRIPSGAFIATGAQRDHLKDAQVTGAQLSWQAWPRLAVTGTFTWARSRDLATSGTPKLDVFSSDMGVETRSTEWFADAPVSLRAFAGLGAGARSYNYRKLDVDATNNLAGYGAIGAELGMGRVALRLEARDYASGFRPLVGSGKSEARNDVVIMGAFRFNRRREAEAR